MGWIKKSITRTMGFAILPFIFILFSTYFYFLNVQIGNYFGQQSKAQLIKDSEHISTEIQMFVQRYTTIVDQSKKNPDFIKISKEVKDGNRKRQNPLYDRVTNQLKEITNLDKNIALSHIALSDANDLIGDFYAYDVGESYDLKKRDWYTNTIEEGKTTVTAPYLDLVTGKMTITIAAPIMNQGEVLGTFGLDIMIEDINLMMQNYKVGDDGYAVLVHKNGRVLYHPYYDTTDTKKSIFLEDLFGRLSEELLSGKSGIASHTNQEAEEYVAYSPVKNTNWTVLTIVPKAEVFYQLKQFIATNLFILIGLVALTGFFLSLLKNFISAPVVKISREIENYSNHNNYSLPEKYLSREDEIGVLSRGLTYMLQQISDYVLEIEEKNQELSIAKEKISVEHSLFQTTIHSLGDAVISTDKFGKIRIMNHVAESLTGWSWKEAKGKRFDEVFRIINELTRETCTCPVEKVLCHGQVVQLEEHTLLIHKSGQETPIEDSAAPIKDKEGNINGAVIVFRDFTEKKQKQEEILFLSYHDQLTGLYNRRYFEEELKRIDVKRYLPLSVAMVDINGLKLTNDAFGHLAGDAILTKVAEILKLECRANHTIARIGGDEFIILLPNTTEEEAENLIKRIYKTTAGEIFHNIIISISIGFDTKLSLDRSIEEVLIKAEENMYRKKISESQSMRNKTIQVILKTLNEKNEREKIHSERVSKISRAIGEMMNLDEEAVKEIATAGLMHDIGKIIISDDILNKPGKITEAEYQEIKRHTESGYQILRSVDAYSSLAENVLYHHERWDGRGYPRGLQGEEIPLIARIIAIADSYEAMTSNRPYREALSHEEAINELIRNSGTQFDPKIINLFIKNGIRHPE